MSKRRLQPLLAMLSSRQRLEPSLTSSREAKRVLRFCFDEAQNSVLLPGPVAGL